MNYDKLAFLVNTVIAANLLGALGSAVYWYLLRRRGVTVTTVEFMYGPGAIKFQLFGAEVRVGSIPTGSSVSCDVPQFRAQPLAWRLMVMLAGPTTVMTVAVLSLGPIEAGQQLLDGFMELLLGVFQPRTYAQHLIAQLHQVYDLSHWKALGILSAKIVASLLFPVSGTAFAHVVRQFYPNDESKSLATFFTWHAHSALAFTAVWAFAVTYHAFKAS